MGGGAWPFLVGGVICLVNSDNERDLNLLNSMQKRLTGEAVRSVWWLWLLHLLSGSLMISVAS